MLKRSILISFAIVLLAGVSAHMLYAAETVSPWLLGDNPTTEKITDMPDNVMPSASNLDCQRITTRLAGTNTMRDQCATYMPLGLASVDGLVFNGSSESIPVVPPPGYINLYPVPGQSLMYTYTNASVIGMYMHFYRNIYYSMPSRPSLVNGRLQYTLTKNPDFTLRDPAGKSMAVNIDTLTFSRNGNWMVVDVPYSGFVRVNMATLEMVPFAPSLNASGDYSSRPAQVTVSDDGRFVAIKPDAYDSFKVYDVASCVDPTWPVDTMKPKCQSRDYWSYLAGRIPNLKMTLQPRFVNQNQLSFLAVYDYTSATSLKVAKYVMTAPGQAASGINYLGLGDSFAAGQGAFNYVEGTDTANNGCHLSGLSYPLLMRTGLMPGAQSVACSGAKTKDILENSELYEGQVIEKIAKRDRSPADIQSYLTSFTPGYLSQTDFVDTYRPEVISLSIGGNDIGFSDILKQCVSPVADNMSCFPTYEDQAELYRSMNGAYDRLVRTYSLIHRPGKRVYVVGYPQIALPGGNCAANVHLDARELELSANLINHLNGVIAAAALKAGVYYVDVSQSLAGHRMCENNSREVAVNGFTLCNDEGIGGFKFIGAESYHPNALGHEMLERALRAGTDNLTKPMPAADPTSRPPELPENTLSVLPKTNRALRVIVPAERLAQEVLVAGQSYTISVNSSTTLLQSAGTYTIDLHSTPTRLGTVTTATDGSFTYTVSLPAGTPPGFHTLHIFGQNLTGQPLDIFKTVYVAASTEDYNGDGVPNTADPCTFLPSSGIDADTDGIDDACDPAITEPVDSGERAWSARLTGNRFHISN